MCFFCSLKSTVLPDVGDKSALFVPEVAFESGNINLSLVRKPVARALGRNMALLATLVISISYAAAAGSEAGSEASGFSITLVGASSPLVFPEGFLAGLVGVHLVVAAVDLLLGRRGRLRVCAEKPMDDYKHLPIKEGRAWTMPFNASSDRIYHSKCTLVFDTHSTDCFQVVRDLLDLPLGHLLRPTALFYEPMWPYHLTKRRRHGPAL